MNHVKRTTGDFGQFLPNPNFEYTVSGEIVHDEVLRIKETYNDQIITSVYRLKDRFIREALIQMGWTPPKES
jgi:hypothetical protein